MRQITAKAAGAFCAGRSMTTGNTAVYGASEGRARLRLHGSAIAWTDGDGTLTVTLAGWPTPTTRERINGLLAVWCKAGRAGFYQHRYGQFFASAGRLDLAVGASDRLTVDRDGRLVAVNGQPLA